MVEQDAGKTTLVQKNKMNQKVIWVSQIPLSKDRENNIRECFIDEEIDFKYPNNIDAFDDLLTIFKDKKKHIMKII